MVRKSKGIYKISKVQHWTPINKSVAAESLSEKIRAFLGGGVYREVAVFGLYLNINTNDRPFGVHEFCVDDLTVCDDKQINSL